MKLLDRDTLHDSGVHMHRPIMREIDRLHKNELASRVMFSQQTLFGPLRRCGVLGNVTSRITFSL
jgi:hypothetical protein